MVLGKIIGGIAGLLLAGPLGLVLGIILGHQFDKHGGRLFNPISREEQQRIREMFFRTVFTLLGKLAKADGRISEREIAHTEQLMQDMGLQTEHRREAISLFKQGAKPEFSLDRMVQEFNRVCGNQRNLKRMLLNYLISMAIVDGHLAKEEESILRQVAQALGFSPMLFDQFLNMIRAQAQFRAYGAGSQRPPSTQSELALAYTALGVDGNVSDTELKKAYRKLMSENHPDKLMGQGVPEDMVKLATERSQEIQTAYDLIRSHRKGRES